MYNVYVYSIGHPSIHEHIWIVDNNPKRQV